MHGTDAAGSDATRVRPPRKGTGEQAASAAAHSTNKDAAAVPLIGLATSDRGYVRIGRDGPVPEPAISRRSAPICLMIRTTASLMLPARS